MKKFIILLSAMVIVAFVGAIIISINDQKNEEEGQDKLQVVTSFYPGYIIGLNIADQIPDIQVNSLTDFSAGCLHDYQLTTGDMKLLSNADVFIMNGGGMEIYLEDVISNYPELTIIDISSGINMLDSLEEEGELNPHVWLDPRLYVTQIENASEGLIKYLESSEVRATKDWVQAVDTIKSNTSAYVQQVNELEVEFEGLLQEIKADIETEAKNKVIIFHDSFAYLANRAGLEVAYTVEIEGDTALSATDIKNVIELVRNEDIRYLFTEQQYGDTITNRIEEETEAKAYVIDSAVTGDGTKGSYINSMKKNLLTLKTAFE